MPFYTFSCTGCGPFDVLRPMAEAGAPAACPECGGGAARVFSAPALSGRSAGALADAVDERSRHAPERVTRAGAGHGHDHSHGGGHAARGRPWQISH